MIRPFLQRPSGAIPRRWIGILTALVGTVLIAGCGTTGGTAAVTNPAPTVSVTGNPASISAGISSTLTVAATNATSVTVTGSDGSSKSLQPSGGSYSVAPAATTTYTATATGAGGSATAQATITVTAAPVAPTVSITASPASVVAGNSSTLTVTATNATSVTVAGSDGSSKTLQPNGGTDTVTPTATTTYTATATGTGGSATAQATVTVTAATAAPTVAITASPTSITAGNSSTLTVTATNATSVIVTGSDGSSKTLQAAGGTDVVSPTATTTYTATATGAGGNATAQATVTVTASTPAPTVTISANPTSITSGNSSTLTITATNATQVTVTGNDGSSDALQPTGGTDTVSPTATTIYTATATGAGGTTTASATVTVTPAGPGNVDAVDHVIFILQENHTFDNYFGMLNPYRRSNKYNVGDDGVTYDVDGIDDKLSTITNQDDEGQSFPLFKFKTTCIDDETSSWLGSYGEVNRYDFTTSRTYPMDGFVHNAEGFAKSCQNGGCSGAFTDTVGQRAMGYYDQDFLNYYYYMASQFAVSDRWFSPVSSKSVDNRIATFTGGTTQGLTKDPNGDDHLNTQLNIPTIFEELQQANISWKVYYSVTQGFCLSESNCSGGAAAEFPATYFTNLSYSYQFLYENPSGAPCTGTTQPSSVVGDSSNSFCIDPNHIVPLSQYFTDLNNGTLPNFAFIEAGYGNNDEHPGSGQSVLSGQAQVANIVNSLMSSTSWKDTVFFLSYDEGGGPYDHVPPVPGHSNQNTDASLGTIPDISSIAVNADSYNPCLPSGGTPTTHCDLISSDPGANPADAAAQQGFAAQLGFRLPNIVISPFTRRHYVSHIPMDHTAVIKFVESRFLGASAHLTNRDAAQPNLLNFFDFNNIPWSTPPTPPAPVTAQSLGYDPCTPASMGP